MFSIGAASFLTGVNVETIRYYERKGIVPRPARTASGRRTYNTGDIERLRFVKRCRNLDFSIRDIQVLLDLAQNTEAPCPQARAVGKRHLADVGHKIDRLRQLERALAALLGQCNDDQSACPLLNRLLHDSDPQTSPD